MTNVIEFPRMQSAPAPSPLDRPANPHIVRFLTQLLAQAEAGNIRSLGIVHSFHEGAPGIFWKAGLAEILPLVGLLDVLKSAVISDVESRVTST